MTYYNENDRRCAEWLRELMKAGVIPAGHVDERSILNVKADELEGFTQHHFFAGIGGWAYALRLAGWPDDKAVWTGSCPCQPFSSAGKAQGLLDERHLWPAFRGLISQRHPATIFGEQVASKDGRAWLAGVRSDLEGMGYAVGASDLCAASVGAPQIRQRIYWVADANSGRRVQLSKLNGAPKQNSADGNPLRPHSDGCGFSVGVADASESRRKWSQNARADRTHETGIPCGSLEPERSGSVGGMADPEMSERRRSTGTHDAGRGHEEVGGSSVAVRLGDAECAESTQLGRNGGQVVSSLEKSNGRDDSNPWSRYELLPCADGKSRRIESGTFPLAHGVSGRVGLLRGYGNAIVPQVAAQFIQVFLDP